MKKFGLFILSLFTVILIGNFTQANSEYEYTNLDITANILIDGTINVKEDFTADFFVQKHGIIRNIPLNYNVEGQDFHIEVSNINVQGKNFTTNKNNGNIEIKIGDADKTLIGKQSYPISYSTYGLIRNFSGIGYTELYWNLVGYDFDTNINKIRAEIYLPKIYTGFTADDFLITTDGSTKTVKEFGGKINRKKGDKIIIIYDKGLSAYQGITLAIKFPNDYFEFDHEKQAKLIGKAGNNLLDNLGSSSGGSLLEIIIALGFVGLFIYAFTKKDKNKNSIDTKSGALSGEFADRFPVIVQYGPPAGLNCAEVGLLLHRQAKPKDMLSLIYKRAAEGLISISTEKTEGSIFSSQKDIVIITKNRQIPGDLPGYEQDFFRSLVRNKKNEIDKSTNLYSKLGLSSLESYGKNKGRFSKFSKQNIKKGGRFVASLLILILSMIYLPSDVIEKMGPITFCLVIFGFGIFGGDSKLKETEQGAELISHILGYREFLAKCDENKLKLFLQQDPLYFDKILPYAVAFGLETEILKKIEPIMQEMNIKSNWYNGNFNSMYMINNIISSAAKNSVPPSSSYSSGGGFSSGSSFGGGFSIGGGGGGGGGRSW